MRLIRERIYEIAFSVDEYCCEKSVYIFEQPYNIFRLLQMKLVLRIQSLAQRILPNEYE